MNKGKTKKIGLIVPSSNTVMEPDFYRSLPEDITLHTARMYLKEVTINTEVRMLDEYTLPAARDLATISPDVVVFGCTSASALRGIAYEEQLIEEISQACGAPAVSVSRAVRETLKKMKARQLVVVTPYIDALNERIRSSLEQAAFEVLNLVGLGILENTNIAEVAGEEILQLAQKAINGYQPDALFVSCTNFPAVRVISELRTLFDFPVTTSNQAVLERTLDIFHKSS